MIARTADHTYIDSTTGKRYPGVTGILKVLDKSGPLITWAARETADAFLALIADRELDHGEWHYPALSSLIDASGPDGVKAAMTARSGWKRDEAASLGTEVHKYADMVVRSVPTPSMSEAARERVLRYADWWQSSGWTVRLTEALVLEPDIGYGGTFDLLARDQDGRTVLADVKTGKGVYREAILQLAAYGMASLVQPAAENVMDPKTYPMVRPDRYAIIHVTASECRVIEVPIGDAERRAFLACLELHRWADSVKGTRL